MESRSILVKVPATVGNFAGAMNCAAMALEALLNVKVTLRADGHVGIRYFGENGERVPRDRTNLVVRAMEAALHLKGFKFAGADFEIYSSVPVAVGLGSSTAAVLAGLIAADRLYALNLNEKTIFDLARIYEARCDNLLAAWHGGFVACNESQPFALLRQTFVPRNFVLSVVAPEPVSSPRGQEEQEVPPAELKGQPTHSQRAQLLADMFMRPGRPLGLEASLPPTSKGIVAGLAEAIRVRTEDMLGVFICGSGPAVGILTRKPSPQAIAAVRKRFLDFSIPSTFGIFRPSNLGARKWNAAAPRIAMLSLGSAAIPYPGAPMVR